MTIIDERPTVLFRPGRYSSRCLIDRAVRNRRQYESRCRCAREGAAPEEPVRNPVAGGSANRTLGKIGRDRIGLDAPSYLLKITSITAGVDLGSPSVTNRTFGF